jgi:hypothetical protein
MVLDRCGGRTAGRAVASARSLRLPPSGWPQQAWALAPPMNAGLPGGSRFVCAELGIGSDRRRCYRVRHR